MLFGNPGWIAEPEDGVCLADVKPVEGSVEENDRVFTEPLDQLEGFVNGVPPDFVQHNGAIFHSILEENRHPVQPDRLGVKIESL